MADVIDRYPRCRLDGTRWILVEAEDRVMPEIPAEPGRLRHARAARPRDRDPHRHAARRGGRRTRRRSRPASGSRRAPSCWTAGVQPPPVVRELGLPLGRRRPDRGRRRRMRVAGPREHLGDRRRRRGARPGEGRQARQPAHGPARPAPGQGRGRQRGGRARRGRPLRRFRYRTLGVFVDMGQHKAVATMLGVRLRGFPAWFAARTYHLVMMPGMARQAAAGGGLDGGPVLRPRLRRARPARPPAARSAASSRTAEQGAESGR